VDTTLAVINTIWPILVGFAGLVFWLAKSWADIETLKDKVHALFDLFNRHIQEHKERD
jgi:hypothetical protein